MFIRETDVQPPVQKLTRLQTECRLAQQSTFRGSQVAENFNNFIDITASQLPECILFRVEGPQGLRMKPLADTRNRLQGIQRLPRALRKKVIWYLLDGSEIYKYNEERYRRPAIDLLPESSKFTGFDEIKKRDISLHPLFDSNMPYDDFDRIKEITSAIGNIVENTSAVSRTLGFRQRDLIAWIQSCEQARRKIVEDYVPPIKEQIFDLIQVIMSSSEFGRKIPTVIGPVRNRHDPFDDTKYYFFVRDGRLVSIPEGGKMHLSIEKVEAPIACWYGAAEDIENRLLAVLPPSWIAALKLRN